MCFYPHLGIRCVGGGGLLREWSTTCSCSFRPEQQKIEVSETYFSDIRNNLSEVIFRVPLARK